MRFWATSTDKPSRLWEEGVTYFNTLKEISEKIEHSTQGTPKTARIVILKFGELFDDYNNNRDKFDRFIDWHEQPKSKFKLRVHIIDSYENFEESIRRVVVRDSDPLKDFLIKDSDFIYGRIKPMPGNRAQIKFIPHIPESGLDTFQSYCRLFENIWNNSYTPNEIMAMIDREKQKKPMIEYIRKEYAAEFKDKSEGEKFFSAVCDKIATAQTTLIAVDIADRKSSALNWSIREEYRSFLNASIRAAQNGISVQRIFVLETFQALANMHLKRVVKNQLEAGMEVIIIKDQILRENQLEADDFILVDDKFGFKLSDSEFDKYNLELGKNLIPSILTEDFKALFRRMYENSAAIKFKGSEGISQFELFLQQECSTA